MASNGQKLKVIIVGAGVAGSMLVSKCVKFPELFDVTLVSPTDFSEVSQNLISHLFEKQDE